MYRRGWRTSAALLLVFAVFVGGCSKPQAGGENQRLIASLNIINQIH